MKVKNTQCLWVDGLASEELVSVSQIQTFLSCRKKWCYAYVDNLTPRIDRSYLTIGKLCHKGMQAAMQAEWEDQQKNLINERTKCDRWLTWAVVGRTAIVDEWTSYVDSISFLDEEVPQLDQLLSDALAVFDQAYEEFQPWRYEIVSVMENGKASPALELHFLVPCAGSTRLHGYIDAILKDTDTGFTWCTDYKFRKTLAPDEDEAFNIQNAVYAHACAKMKIPITGTMTWQHINTPAADPVVLQNGSVSKAKIKTTWTHYATFLTDRGLDPGDYKEMIEKLSDIEWFRSTLEYRNSATIKRIWTDCVLPVAYEIQKARNPKAKLHRSMYPWNCKMCQFQSLCQGELRDYDVPAIVEREYTKRS